MNRWHKYLWAGKISAQSNLAYMGDVIGRILFLGVVLYIFLRLWKVTFTQTQAVELGGLTLAQMLWYLTATEAMTLSGPRVAQAVDEDVRTGVLAVQLVRPINYVLYRLATTLGERVVRFSLNLAVGTVIALALVGPINFSLEGLGIYLLSVPLAFVLDFLGHFMIGLGAFWLEDTSGLFLIYSRLTMILGGMLIPIGLFPESLQPLVKALPFSSVIFGPAHLFVHPNWNEYAELLARQSMGILAFGLIVAFLYSKAQKRVFANGG